MDVQIDSEVPKNLPVLWNQIKTAPQDGTFFLAYWPSTFSALTGFDKNEVVITTWFKHGKWHSPYESADLFERGGPTHWLPLPNYPLIDADELK